MNMQSAWAAPVFYVPGEDRGRLCTIERALPGSLMVNQKGERYLNEAASYHITGQQMARREREHGDASPSWFVFDHRYRHSYPVGPLYPIMPDWAHPAAVRGILKKGRTIADLARAIEPLYLKIFLKSAWVAALTTGLCLVIGFPVAYSIAFRGGKYKNILLGMVVIPFFTSYLIVAVCLYKLSCI